MNYFKNLSEKDQKTLLIGGIVAAIVLFVFGFLIPLQKNITQLHQEIAEAQALNAWMQPAIEIISQTKKNTDVQKPQTTSEKLSLLDKTIESQHLKPFLKTMAQQNSGQIFLEFKQIPMTSLLDWLQSLREQSTLSPSTLSIEKVKVGIVDAQVYF